MINIVDVEATLRRRYPNLEKVVDGVFRAIDHHGSSDYAIRYFDLNDRLLATAGELRKYQDNIISEKYFDGKTATDLRWNHYLYFVTSEMVAKQDEFRQAKAVVESDREYARKQVLLETDVERLFEPKQPKKHSQSLPVDLATIWTRRLEECGMGFALDDGVQIPKVVQRIADGDKQKAGKVLSPVAPTPAEMAAASCFIKRLSFEGFRLYPQVKDYSMGKVNLIVGSNGVGKTSLLEAIEYLYCGKNKRQGEVPSGTSIMAEMVGTAERLKTTSTSDKSRLRARHSNWYAKSELKKLTISDSFAKFNFLDTDAAVRLTVESSKERIGDDVSRLLLGAEAEKLSDRIVRVQDQIIITLKDINNDVSRRELQRHESKIRLNNLRGMPQLSDSLFAEFVVALKHLNWLQLPTDKHQAIALRENLQAAISYAQTLQKSEIEGLTGDVANVQGLRQSLDAASQLHELEKACRLEAIKLEDPLRAAAIPIVVLNKLMPYAAAGYARLTRHRQELQQSVAELSAKLVGFSPLRPPAVPERIQDQPVSIAAHAASVLLEEQRKRLSDADSTLKAFENTQSDLMVLNQRLLAVAQDLLRSR